MSAGGGVPALQGQRRLEGAAGVCESCTSSSLLAPCWASLTPPLPPSPQVNTFGATHPLTSLVPSLQEVDPDEAFSSVPYEKGFALLFHLEELLGGPGETHLRVGEGGGGTHLRVEAGPPDGGSLLLRGLHGLRQVLHPAVCLRQRDH